MDAKKLWLAKHLGPAERLEVMETVEEEGHQSSGPVSFGHCIHGHFGCSGWYHPLCLRCQTCWELRIPAKRSSGEEGY
jgi:hypothetical protein